MTFDRFADRTDAGKRLAKALMRYKGKENTVVIGLPRGGVITAAALADEIDLPLDVLVVRKLGTPGHEELAMGAIGPGGVRVLNEDVIRSLRITPMQIDAAAKREEAELQRRERLYRAGLKPLDFSGQTVILVDDGLATGSTMEAAIRVVRHHAPARIILAVPVAPAETCEHFRSRVDELVCLQKPEPFQAVGLWYRDFAQVDDAQVIQALAERRNRMRIAAS